MTFDQFCDKQFLSLADRQAFRQWLGELADNVYSEAQWWTLFSRFVKRRPSGRLELVLELNQRI